jgi:hypothetical protein
MDSYGKTGKTEEPGQNIVPMPLCPPQNRHGLTRARTQASVVRDRRLIAWDMTRPMESVCLLMHEESSGCWLCVNFCATQRLDSRVRIPLGNWCVRVFLCCAVLCRHRIGNDPPPPLPLSHEKCLKDAISELVLNRKSLRSRSMTTDEQWREGNRSGTTVNTPVRWRHGKPAYVLQIADSGRIMRLQFLKTPFISGTLLLSTGANVSRSCRVTTNNTLLNELKCLNRRCHMPTSELRCLVTYESGHTAQLG